MAMLGAALVAPYVPVLETSKAMWTMAVGGTLATALNFSLTKGVSRENAKKYNYKPKIGTTDFDTVNRAMVTRDNGILNNGLETVFECEPDNLWFKSLALARSSLSTRQKYIRAFTTGLFLGLKHNAFTSFYGRVRWGSDHLIAFRLHDAAYRRGPLWENADGLSMRRPGSFLTQNWIRPSV